jgi:formate/nitrite transporter FocA (FNT family)
MFTARRFGLAVLTLPIAGLAYGAVYFGLALVANSYASAELFTSNLTALGISWVVVVTFSKQILDFLDKIGE